MERAEIENLIRGVTRGDHSLNEAVGILLNEMGRGGRILIVDENMLGLEKHLSDLNYTTYPIRRRKDDDQIIKEQIYGKILVTRNGEDFVKDVERLYYGLIWVQSDKDFALLAKDIEAAMVRSNFKRNLTQVVKV